MRVAPEAFDDALVALLVVDHVRHAQLLEELFGAFVDAQRFAVHEGHVKKASLGQVQFVLGACGNGLLGQAQRQRIGGKRLRGVAVDVA